jgi:hypothetical protein
MISVERQNDDYSLDINSLSFKEYILVDCLKFKHKEKSISNNLTFVALTKQGFLNIFNEIINVSIKRCYALKLCGGCVVFRVACVNITIKYSAESNIKKILDLPGLDFYKRTLRVL